MSDSALAVLTETHGQLSAVDSVLDRLNSIQELMRKAMDQGVDFGVIPGTNSKPTLLKPGAEKLCLMFRFAPEYKTSKHFDNGHLTVECECRILSADGAFLGSANAIASTRESKYAYRKAERVCPKCGKAAIIKGKEEYGGGWLCWKKPDKGKDGCGAKFPDDCPEITSQAAGRVDNTDLADSYNTVLRIAEKRAYIAAVRLVTGSSALFDEEHGQTEKDPPEERADAKAPTPCKADPGTQDKPKEPLPTLTPIELQDWLTTILHYRDEKEFTNAAPKIEKAPEGSRAALRKALLERAAAQGYRYERTISMFVKAEKQRA